MVVRARIATRRARGSSSLLRLPGRERLRGAAGDGSAPRGVRFRRLIAENQRRAARPPFRGMSNARRASARTASACGRFPNSSRAAPRARRTRASARSAACRRLRRRRLRIARWPCRAWRGQRARGCSAEIVELRRELRLGLRIPLEPAVSVAGVVVELRQRRAPGVLFVRRLFQEAAAPRRICPGRSSSRRRRTPGAAAWDRLPGEPAPLPRAASSASWRASAICASSSCAVARDGIGFGRHVGGQLRVLARIFELALLEERPRPRRDIRAGPMASARCSACRRPVVEIKAIDAAGKGGQLTPDVGHRRIGREGSAAAPDRLQPFPLAGELDRGAIGLENLVVYPLDPAACLRHPSPSRFARRHSPAPAIVRARRPDLRRRVQCCAGRQLVQGAAQRLARLAFARRRCSSARADRAASRTALRAAP